jgi:hypothetical protein
VGDRYLGAIARHYQWLAEERKRLEEEYTSWPHVEVLLEALQRNELHLKEMGREIEGRSVNGPA